MAHKVSIEKFESTAPNAWIEYIERLNSLFTIHEVEDPDIRRAVLIGKCGPVAYSVMRDLCSPALPAATNYETILERMENYYCPKPLKTLQRFRFHKREQQENETFATYVRTLRRLDETCEYGTMLNEMICDQIVYGVIDRRRRIQRPHRYTSLVCCQQRTG